MRAFLRQNPDIIMVGEIRDTETAEIAVQAALTGHLVLTTLHTETAAGATPRLIAPWSGTISTKIDAASGAGAAIGEGFMRPLQSTASPKRGRFRARSAIETLAGINPVMTVYEPRGCERCSGFGYRGRIGVFEVIEVVGEVREHVQADVDFPRPRGGGVARRHDDYGG